jgi:hypothetical protein
MDGEGYATDSRVSGKPGCRANIFDHGIDEKLGAFRDRGADRCVSFARESACGETVGAL